MQREYWVGLAAALVGTACSLALLNLGFQGAYVLLVPVSLLNVAGQPLMAKLRPAILLPAWGSVAMAMAAPHDAFTPLVRGLLLTYLWFLGWASWEVWKASRAAASS